MKKVLLHPRTILFVVLFLICFVAFSLFLGIRYAFAASFFLFIYLFFFFEEKKQRQIKENEALESEKNILLHFLLDQPDNEEAQNKLKEIEEKLSANAGTTRIL